MPMYDVAVIGYGASGALTLAQLVRRGAHKSIAVVDPTPDDPRGVAYSTPHAGHRLNVRADRMGAWPDAIDDFLTWAQSDAGHQARASLGDDRPVTADAFLSRALYGAYLQHIHTQTAAQATAKGITITRYTGRIETLRADQDHWAMDDIQASARHVVLALGHHLPPVRAGVITDPFSFDYQTLQHLPAHEPIVVIGTGLTAVDCITAILNSGWAGPIIARSRKGWLSLPHATDSETSPVDIPAQTWIGLSPSALMHATRHCVRRGAPWRMVMDALRPLTPVIWQHWSAATQTRVMRKYLTLWNIHRHRMAPDIHARLSAARDAGCLQIHTTKTAQPAAAMVFDCTGPRYHPQGLLAHLIDTGHVDACANGYGIAVLDGHRVSHPQHPGLYAVGIPLLGALFETIAIPELRVQAHTVAQQIP